MNAIYVGGALGLLALVAFLAYYVIRLAGASRGQDDSESRLAQLARQSAAPPPALGRDQAGTPRQTPAPVGRPGSAVLRRPGVGLAGVFTEPVFVKRDKGGQVSFQAAGRPLMPLKLLLDPRARSPLERAAAAAVLELGPVWTLLAHEDEQGDLVLTPL